MKTIYLICNAHLDPMWLWEWEEGAAAALSTFRSAVSFCEEYDAFVFNHNEALLYKWIEEYEPALFERIRRQIERGRWRVIGGWYLQPDCLMPSGEGFARQILEGNRYFEEKFGLSCRTAVNFDSFGHTRGLVQILAKCGYENYLVCRPTRADRPDLANEFDWLGFDGSRVRVRRHYELYNSPLGGAAEKIEQLVRSVDEGEELMILWGVGNHGGGPSRKDIDDIAALSERLKAEDIEIRHSTPDDYFEARKGRSVPTVAESLTPCNTGCLTSMALVKQRYRELENLLFSVEKMASHADAAGLVPYPAAELKEAVLDLLFLQFHDILPGSAIRPVERAALLLAGHAGEILSRIRARCFFALAGRYRAEPDTYPVLVYNPHPYPVRAVAACEFQLADQNWEDSLTLMRVYGEDGAEVPSQIEKEHCNLNLDWRKRVVFDAALRPMSMNLFTCRPYRVEGRKRLSELGEKYLYESEDLKVTLDCRTGLICSVQKAGDELLKGAVALGVCSDTEDPWAMQRFQYERLGEPVGEFRLMTRAEAQEYAHIKAELPPVRMIEDGPVRTVIEALFVWNHSFAVVHYLFSKIEPGIELRLNVIWNEKDRALKLRIPLALEGALYSDTAFGVQQLKATGTEQDVQRFFTVRGRAHSLTVLNGAGYAVSMEDGILMPTLLRSPAYTGHPINDREILHQDRWTPRMDQGEREFGFKLCFDLPEDRTSRAAELFGQQPYALSFFPLGKESPSAPLLELSDGPTTLSACKRAEDGHGWIVRLYNGSENASDAVLRSPLLGAEARLKLTPYEVRTLRLADGGFTETDMLERPL